MNDFSKNPIKSEFIKSNNKKISASLYEYDDHILFNQYLIGEEIYGVTLFKCLYNRIKIIKSDLRKFTFDLLVIFLNKIIHNDDFITHLIQLKNYWDENLRTTSDRMYGSISKVDDYELLEGYKKCSTQKRNLPIKNKKTLF